MDTLYETDKASSCGRSTDDIEVLQRWKSEAIKMSEGHKKAFELYRVLNTVANATTIGLSSCSGICTVVLAAALIDPTFTIAIVSGVTSVAVGGLLSIVKMMSFSEKMTLHERFSADFAELARDISQEHSLRLMGKSQYSDPAEFMKIVNDRLDRLGLMAPSLPGC